MQHSGAPASSTANAMLPGLAFILMPKPGHAAHLHEQAAHGTLAAGPTARADMLLGHNWDACRLGVQKPWQWLLPVVFCATV